MPSDAAARVFDRAHQTLVWLAVLVFVLPEPAPRGLVVAARHLPPHPASERPITRQ